MTKINKLEFTHFLKHYLSLQVGINEKESDMAYDAVLISTFADTEALARYKVHPEHVKISNYCKKIRESRTFVDFTE
ncbi:MAG: Dabb family protein [Butyricimonas virosa]